MGECVKRFIVFLLLVFCSVAHADTETINWYMDDNVYATTTCESGGDITLPTAPTKYGYTFQGWKPKYTKIQYLESTGTQWIDADIKGNINTKIMTKFEPIVGSSDYNSAIIGGNISDSSKAISLLVRLQNGRDRTNRFGNTEFQFTTSCYPNTVYTFSADKNNVMLNENIVGSFNASNYFETVGNLFLFNINPIGRVKVGSIRIFYFQIYDNDILVRDFIPVLDQNGVPCMYDRVEQKFYYNAGAGDFIAGPVIGE